MNDIHILNHEFCCNDQIKTYNLNFEKMDINPMIQLQETQNKTTIMITVELVVQKLHVSNDHIVLCTDDQQGIYAPNKS